MPRWTDPAKSLSDMISRLLGERRTHMTAVERIDALFKRFGIRSDGKRGPGRPPGSSSAVKEAPQPARRGRKRRRTRGSFPVSGRESVLNFVGSKGSKGATTSEINKHWQEEGRAGSAYVTIGHLVDEKKLRRENLKGQRGSRYTAA